MIGGRKRMLGPGEHVEVPAGARHDWWQVGEDEAQVVVEVAPGDRFVEMVGKMFGLAREGKVDERGLPHPLRLAVTASAFRDTLMLTAPPRWLQRAMFGALAPLGRALGRRPSYERYLSSSEVVEPDPRALALLGRDGRLAFDAGAAV